MNWYKNAQQSEVLDSQDIKGKGRFYTDIGHDINYGEQNRLLGKNPNKDYSAENPNIMWIYNNGKIETKPETEEDNFHGSGSDWGLSGYLDELYTGRYSPSKKTISVLSPLSGVSSFRGIPKSLQYLLQQKFPGAKRMVRY